MNFCIDKFSWYNQCTVISQGLQAESTFSKRSHLSCINCLKCMYWWYSLHFIIKNVGKTTVTSAASTLWKIPLYFIILRFPICQSLLHYPMEDVMLFCAANHSVVSRLFHNKSAASLASNWCFVMWAWLSIETTDSIWGELELFSCWVVGLDYHTSLTFVSMSLSSCSSL